MIRRHSLILLLFAALFSLQLVAQEPAPVPANAPYKNPKLAVDQRVKDLLSRMTLEEKATMLAGSGWMESPAIPRLGIPAIKMADGPLGVRNWTGSSSVTNAANAQVKITATAFPSGIAMGATWNPALMSRVAQATAQEFAALGRDMMLGPTVNINRQPLWGRNFEAYGEDPYLTSRMAVAYIKAAQAEGVIPSLKHFDANNQEFERHRIDETIDERTLHEIYLPAFKAAVQEADVWNVMSAYNLVNGTHCAESQYLLDDVLRKEFGFKGFVVSDWMSTYSTAATVNAGMDLEMPGGEPARKALASPRAILYGSSGTWLEKDKVLAAVKAGEISPETVDRNAGRILRVIFLAGLFEHQHAGGGAVDTPEQQAIALEGATEGIVLLKNNDNLLPLDPKKIKSIAVIGPNAVVARTGGGGSSKVLPAHDISPLDGIKARAGANITVTSALGVAMEGEATAASTPPGTPPNPNAAPSPEDSPEAHEKTIGEAVAAAARADVAVVVVGRYFRNESEGFDMKSLDLPSGQDDLIAAVENANPRTIVVLNTGNPVTVSKWLDRTPALLDMWYAGQEGGRALAAVLFGDANPSGKLPVTFPKRLEDTPAFATYPGKDLKTSYAEGIYVGYRYYDSKGVEPQFPFGYGLSYTNFKYANLKLQPAKGNEPVKVSVQVKNTGSRAGAEVVELYVHDNHSHIDRPIHELKGFERVQLGPGQTKTVTITLNRDAFSYWNPKTKAWQLDPGEFGIEVGSSSRDIRLRGDVEVQ